MLGLYFHAELVLSRRNPKEKGGGDMQAKSHIVYIGHNPHAHNYIYAN